MEGRCSRAFGEFFENSIQWKFVVYCERCERRKRFVCHCPYGKNGSLFLLGFSFCLAFLKSKLEPLLFQLQFVNLQKILDDDSKLKDPLHRNARMEFPIEIALQQKEFEELLKRDSLLKTVVSSMEEVGVWANDWLVFLVQNIHALLATLAGRRRFTALVNASTKKSVL